MRESAEARADTIIDVVIDLIESEGYEAVQVRTVAKRARVSLATMYKLFGTLDDLIVSALERWMDAHTYSALTMPEPGESPYETWVRVLRAVFKPWEKHPRVLEAYHWARSTPSGKRLDAKGMAIVQPIVDAAVSNTNADAEYLSDVLLIHSHVVRAAIARFADGEIAITDILPILERTLFRLTLDNRIKTVRARPRRADATEGPKTAKPRRAAPSTRRNSAKQ